MCKVKKFFKMSVTFQPSQASNLDARTKQQCRFTRLHHAAGDEGEKVDKNFKNFSRNYRQNETDVFESCP